MRILHKHLKQSISGILAMLVLICALSACHIGAPTVEVNTDGYIVVNGNTTNIVADKDDVITTDADGYVIVNGVKTEYKVQSNDQCIHSFNADGICTMCNIANPNTIHYSINLGTKIETLSLNEQQLISEYVEDCQKLYTGTYAGYACRYWGNDNSFTTKPYLLFTDTFVYDFRSADESNMDKNLLILWDSIKALSDGTSKPIMYIELCGYIQYFPDEFTLTTLQDGNFMWGYFIYEDETVVPYSYKKIGNECYAYKIPEETEIINCGNKYADEKSFEELIDFYIYITENEGANLDTVLHRLHLN